MVMPNSREQFEAAYAKAHPVTCTTVANVFERDSEEYTRTTVQVGWVMWQAGAAAEREACAKICEDIRDKTLSAKYPEPADHFQSSVNYQIGMTALLLPEAARQIRDRSAP